MLNAHFVKMKQESQQAGQEQEHDSPDDQQEESVLDTQDELQEAYVSDWEEQWNADDKGEDSSTVGMAEETAFTLQKPPSSPEEDTLESRYAKMAVKSSEALIYPLDEERSKYTEPECIQLEAEVSCLIGFAFNRLLTPLPGRDLPDAKTMIEEVEKKTGYRLDTVTRTQNTPHFEMWRQFGKSYGIRNETTAFHGTTEANAKCIHTIGFKGAASRRCKYGKGIYLTTDIWESLAYAEPIVQPDGSESQVVVVGQIWKGASAIGTEGQVSSFDIYFLCYLETRALNV